MSVRTVITVLSVLFLAQAAVPVPAAARPAKLEMSNGLGISLFLVGSAVFGTVVAFSPKNKRGEDAEKNEAKPEEAKRAETKTAEDMKKELLDMRRE